MLKSRSVPRMNKNLMMFVPKMFLNTTQAQDIVQILRGRILYLVIFIFPSLAPTEKGFRRESPFLLEQATLSTRFRALHETGSQHCSALSRGELVRRSKFSSQKGFRKESPFLLEQATTIELVVARSAMTGS